MVNESEWNNTLITNLTLIPNLTPTLTLTPTLLPTAELTPQPTLIPTVVQTEAPTHIPTSEPIIEPTTIPIVAQTEEIALLPTAEPILEPTTISNVAQTEEPALLPAAEPTLEPTLLPTETQTEEPVLLPAVEPTSEPTLIPTVVQTEEPTLLPTSEPIITPFVESISESVDISAEDSAYFHCESVPSGAEVIFDDIGRGPAPVNITVSTTGIPTHTIKMQLPGYQDWSETRPNPTPGITETVNATLLLLPPNGSISVTSSPTGAMVVLDGSGVQTTPYIFSEVTPGSHTIGISKDGYNPYSTSVTVSSGAQATVFAALSPVTSSGSLTVSSDPSNALILLNNIAYGMTPAHFNAIAAGTYNLQLVKPGYQTVSKTIDIIPGAETPVSISIPRRIPVTGTLTVRSTPSGGTVTLDGEVLGVTPLRINRLMPNMYSLRVSVPGYLSWIGIIHIYAGRETSIFAPIGQPQPVSYTGSLSVQSEPSGATITLDSIPLGKTPLFIRNVAAGSHTIFLDYPGYLPYSTTAQVWSERTRYISSILTMQPVINRTSDLITLSDDAAIFFKTHGRIEALNAYNNPTSGFNRDGMYVIALDINGTIIADGGNSNQIGLNISEQTDSGGIFSGKLMTTLASHGGGLIYDTILAGENPAQVSLVFIRPAINGVVIGTAIPVSDIILPDPSMDSKALQDAVHAAVILARDYNWKSLEIYDDIIRSLIQPEMSLYSFDRNESEDADIYGVHQSQIMNAAADNDGGYFWILHREEPDIIRLIPGYAEAVDSFWGIWASAQPGEKDVIVMIDMKTISV
ncbi:MAG: PEGA domain-containing protein [Methanobacteriota archaeon]